MTEFYQTRMGQTFYERTLPELVRQLERLNENLERIADLRVRVGQESQPTENDHDEDLHPQNP